MELISHSISPYAYIPQMLFLSCSLRWSKIMKLAQFVYVDFDDFEAFPMYAKGL